MFFPALIYLLSLWECEIGDMEGNEEEESILRAEAPCEGSNEMEKVLPENGDEKFPKELEDKIGDAEDKGCLSGVGNKEVDSLLIREEAVDGDKETGIEEGKTHNEIKERSGKNNDQSEINEGKVEKRVHSPLRESYISTEEDIEMTPVTVRSPGPGINEPGGNPSVYRKRSADSKEQDRKTGRMAKMALRGKRRSEELKGNQPLSTDDEDEDEKIQVSERTKRLLERRRRALESVEGEEEASPMEVISSSSEMVSKRRISSPEEVPRIKRKRKGKTPSPEMEKMVTRSADPNVKDIGLNLLNAATLGTKAMEWVDEVEDMRGKSKNIQGRVSGLMKVKLNRIKEAILSLVLKAEASGDLSFLKMRNVELTTKIKTLEGENVTLKEELKRRKQNGNMGPVRNIEQLEVIPDIQYLIEGDRNEELKNIRARKQEGLKKRGSEEMVMRPPLKGKSTPIPLPRNKTNEPADSEVEINNQIEALIATRREMREEKKRKVEKQTAYTEMENRGKVKVYPRIIEDRMIVPPRGMYLERGNKEFPPLRKITDSGWTTVVTKNKKKQGEELKRGVSEESAGMGRQVQNRAKSPRRRLPSTAAVVITGKRENFSYAGALKEARGKISLAELDIDNLKIRKTFNGGRIIEISGPEGQTKADLLADRLKVLLQNEAIITRPIKKGEIRLIGMDDSVEEEEVRAALSEIGKCATSEIKVGNIRRMNNGLGTVWVQCPLATAIRITNLGKIRIGWTTVKAELLKARPVQCFKCWEFGHISYACKNQVDRRGSCFNCGKVGHNAQACVESPCCMVCKDKGRDTDHRIGGTLCNAINITGSIPGRRPEDNFMDYDTNTATECQP